MKKNNNAFDFLNFEEEILSEKAISAKNEATKSVKQKQDIERDSSAILNSQLKNLFISFKELQQQIEKVLGEKAFSSLLESMNRDFNSILDNIYLSSKRAEFQVKADPLRLLLEKIKKTKRASVTFTEPQKPAKQTKEKKPKETNIVNQSSLFESFETKTVCSNQTSSCEKTEIAEKKPPIKQPKQKPKTSKTPSLIKHSTPFNLSDTDGFESVVEKFLSADATQSQKNESSCEKMNFDLKDAVNPKDDLGEIMKAFDFFNEIE